MRYVNALLTVAIALSFIGTGGCCRPACPPGPQSCGVAEVRRPAPGTKSGGLFLRYFDVKDLDAGSGDVLLHDIRTQVMPEAWEQEPRATMEYRNGIVIVRAPTHLLNATDRWLDGKRSGIRRVRQERAERGVNSSSKSEFSVTQEVRGASSVVEIHSVADLTAGRAGGDVDLHLAGSEEEPTRIRPGGGVPIDALLRGIESVKESASWPGFESAEVRPAGDNALVVKSDPAFQEALDHHLAGLRREFGAGLAVGPKPKEPVRAQPPSDEPRTER